MAFTLSRRTVLAGGLATAVAAGLEVWSGQQIRVARYNIGLKEGLTAPLRIAFLSDQHIIDPWFSLSTWQEIIEQTNQLNPDLIILGGDYSGYNIPHNTLVMPDVIGRVSSTLRAPLGVYAIMGNHDHVANELLGGSWGNRPAMVRGLEDSGIRMLRNESIKLVHNNRLFWLSGVDSHTVFEGDGETPMNIDKALSVPLGDDLPLILAAHEPDVFARHHPRVDLQLSGHMHAGQVRLGPWTPAPMPSRYGTRYLHGLIQEEGKNLIVSSGLGYSRLPIRIGAVPEIVVVETFV